MATYLNPKVDLIFKKVFGEHPDLVKSLLNALLPLPEDMKIDTVEYLTNENIPDSPEKKLAIVNVRCKDNHGRYFIVEMQMVWNEQFFQRTLFNAATTYSHQLEKGNPFKKLRDVYALALVNSEAFEYQNQSGYMQEFYLTNRNYTADVRTDLSLIFVELKRFKPADKGSRAIKDLWLRFLTEIDEQTEKVDDELLENPDINKALDIVKISAYSEPDLYEYNNFLLDLNGLYHSLVAKEEKGRAEGRAEGEKSKAIEIARNFKKAGVDINLIAQNTGLTIDKINNLSSLEKQNRINLIRGIKK